MSFQCVVVTPEQESFSDTVRQVILPAHDGLVGILTGRAPLLVKLGMGPLRVDRLAGDPEVFFVDGGVAQMKDNRLTILTDRAIPAADIDPETIQAEYTHALAQQPTDPTQRQQREHQLAAAKIKQKMVEDRQA